MPNTETTEETIEVDQEQESLDLTPAIDESDDDSGETVSIEKGETEKMLIHAVICQNCGLPMRKKQTVYDCTCSAEFKVKGDTEGQGSIPFDKPPKSTMIAMDLIVDMIYTLYDKNGLSLTLTKVYCKEVMPGLYDALIEHEKMNATVPVEEHPENADEETNEPEDPEES